MICGYLSSARALLLHAVLIWTLAVAQHRRRNKDYVNDGEELRSGHLGGQFKAEPCYSCMSLAYNENWKQLSVLYREPHSFTDRCNEPFDRPNEVGTVNCSNICITMKEPVVQGGVFIGYNWIRGCVDKILVNGYNQSALRTHRLRDHDMCRKLPRAHLMIQPKQYEHPLVGDVRICSCLGNRCNTGERTKAALGVCPSTTLAVWVTATLLLARLAAGDGGNPWPIC